MHEIKYFWEKSIYSLQKGKFYYKFWKQLTIIIFLNIKCLILTGCLLGETNSLSK